MQTAMQLTTKAYSNPASRRLCVVVPTAISNPTFFNESCSPIPVWQFEINYDSGDWK